MSEWTKASVKLPTDGELVDVRLAGGRLVKEVEFSGGRFWKVRTANGGQAYEVEEWREIAKQQGSKKADGATESKNQ